MLTVLNIENRMKGGRWGKLLSGLSLNSLRVSQASLGEISVTTLSYVCRNGRVDWDRISRKAGENRRDLVYCGKSEIPEACGVIPFEPTALRQRLCSNMALEVLELMKELPPKLKVGVYDPRGEFCDLGEFLLRYTVDPVIVTKNRSFYTQQAQRILEETGGVIRVSRNMSALSACGLIISPERIDEAFTPMTKAVVLTSAVPKVPLCCRVYYRYSFRLPKELESIRPEGTDAEAFGGALYSLCGVYSLGSVVPFVCMNGSDTQTTLSLRKYFAECFGT